MMTFKRRWLWGAAVASVLVGAAVLWPNELADRTGLSSWNWANGPFQGRFDGNPFATIASSTVAYADDTPYDPAAVEAAELGRVLRTDLEIEFAPDARIWQVQPTLDAHQAKIIASLPGRSMVVVRIPDPGSFAELKRIQRALAQSKASLR